MTTISVENYLKGIYKLSLNLADEEKVKAKMIADHLHVSLPSVTSMMKSLTKDGWVIYESYRGVRLTEVGNRKALGVIRKHRLMEMFLVQTLNFPWEEVHDEAELLEHAISDKLEAHIAEFLGHPRFDPHGDPIPTVEGEVEYRQLRRLAESNEGDEVIIARVMSQSAEVLRHFGFLGLVPDSLVHVVDKLVFDGQMTLKNQKGTCTISSTLANILLIH